ARLDKAGRIAAYDRPGFDVVEYAGTSGNHRTIANRDARRDEHVGGEPNAVAEGNRCSGQGHGGICVIVAGGAEETVLADRGPRAERDPIYTVAIHVMTEATVIAHRQVPGRPDFSRG